MKAVHFTVVTEPTDGPRQRLSAAAAWTMVQADPATGQERWLASVLPEEAAAFAREVGGAANVLRIDRLPGVRDGKH